MAQVFPKTGVPVNWGVPMIRITVLRGMGDSPR